MKPKPDHRSSVNRRRVLNRIGCLALAPYSLSVAHADATYPSRPITLQPPTLPGLGFEIDEAALAHYGRCFFKANRTVRSWMPESLHDLTIPTTPVPRES